MNSLVLTVGAIITCASFLVAQDKPDAPDGWTKINICRISFFAPPDLKNKGMKGIDSCVAQFANNDIALYMDYGLYGGPLQPAAVSSNGNRKRFRSAARMLN